MKIRIEKIKSPIYREKKEENKDNINFTFSEEKESDNGFGEKIIKLFDKNKNLIGNICFDYPKDDLHGKIKIKFIATDPKFQRKDISLNLYKHLIELAKSKGLIGIKSDNVVQGGALASWKKLEDEGYNLIVNPTVTEKYLAFKDTYSEGKFFKELLRVADNESVFEINLKNK